MTAPARVFALTGGLLPADLGADAGLTVRGLAVAFWLLAAIVQRNRSGRGKS